jgi:hypothetical protein
MRALVVATFVLAGVGAILHPSPAGLTGASSASSSGAPAAMPADPVTPTSWAQALLARVGDPVSAENVRAIVGWERAEGGHWANSAHYNPLNTTQREPGSSSMNSVGVQAFTSWDQGLTATQSTLLNGRYGGILAALAAGSCASCVADAVGASPWGTGRFPV